MNQQKQYIGFAKKYRPGSFKELQGQEVLSKILSYEIINNRLAQGYLLTGIRGVGKTTSARIIAKTINCTNSVIETESVTPCGICENCSAFIENAHPDILEIDAASKTGVDDIRVIIDSSEYRPLLGKYKIFIIDEIHMLSKNAFNALLKVLEEPPAHIIFVFATTEVQKVPITVISRCQRFDLRRLNFKEICALIKKIADAENLKIEDAAITIIAHISEGSARDAISLLDQGANIKSEIITSKAINELLSRIDLADIIKFTAYIINQDADNAVKFINEIYLNGANLHLFTISIANFIAYLSKTKMLPDYSEDIYKTYDKQITDIVIKSNISALSILWQIFSKGVVEIKDSYNQLIMAEMLVFKAIYSTSLPQIGEPAKSNVAESRLNIAVDNMNLDLPQEIIVFLQYLNEQNEREIYYNLMNDVEVKNFTTNILEIGAREMKQEFKNSLVKLLLQWKGVEYDVIITKQAKIVSLKEKLIDNLKKSSEWKMIKQSFPLAEVSDILCNK